MEKESTDPIGKKRTSKHQKKLASRVELRSADPCRVVARSDPRPKICDIPVGGVNAEDSVHGRDLEEDGKGDSRGRGDEGTRVVKTLRGEVALSTISCAVRVSSDQYDSG